MASRMGLRRYAISWAGTVASASTAFSMSKTTSYSSQRTSGSRLTRQKPRPWREWQGGATAPSSRAVATTFS
ncbi:hypothetical protein MYXA107069_36545 [Myxococcus xanthus]